MGNKKRSAALTPIVLKDFAGKKVVGVFAGDNKSGVIVEREDESVNSAKETKWFSGIKIKIKLADYCLFYMFLMF